VYTKLHAQSTNFHFHAPADHLVVKYRVEPTTWRVDLEPWLYQPSQPLGRLKISWAAKHLVSTGQQVPQGRLHHKTALQAPRTAGVVKPASRQPTACPISVPGQAGPSIATGPRPVQQPSLERARRGAARQPGVQTIHRQSPSSSGRQQPVKDVASGTGARNDAHWLRSWPV
jgi:hypothetical protein